MVKLRFFLKDIFASVVKNIILIVLTAVWTLLISYIKVLFGYLKSQVVLDTPAYCILTVILITAAFVTVLLIKRYANKYRPRFPYIDFKFKLIQLVVELEFVTRETILYKLKFHIRATDRVDTLKNKMIWSGSVSGDPEFTDNPRCSIIEAIKGEEKNEKYYNIHFVPPLYKGDEARFEIRYECGDDKQRMNPHLGYRIKWPTKRLILRVVTRENLLSNVRHCVYAEDNDELPLENIMPSQPKVEGSYYVYEWDVWNPHLFFFYRFDWIFKRKIAVNGSFKPQNCGE
jgi:hypothetical protein